MNAFRRGSVAGGDDGCTPAAEPQAAAAPARGGRRGAPPAAAGRGGRAGARGAAPAKPVDAPAVIDLAWTAPSHRLSLLTNYMGTRNRFAVSGVLHARDAAADRSQAAARFLTEALGFAWASAARIKKACEDADKQLLVGRSLPTSARLATIGEVEVLMRAAPADDASSITRPVTMKNRLSYEPASDAVLAAEYFLPAGETAIVDLLKHHGIQVRQLTQPTKGVEEFVLAAGADVSAANWQPSAADVPAGSWVVRMNQPLARLAFALLEPASDEGVARFLRDDKAAYTILRRR
jgi:hypothetical protein